jgi:hypothetical protein
MTDLNIFQGAIVFAIGLGIVLGARRLALLPRYWEGYYLRHPFAARLTEGLRNYLNSDVGTRALVIFWRVCGTLWALSGFILMIDRSRTIRLPWH